MSEAEKQVDYWQSKVAQLRGDLFNAERQYAAAMEEFAFVKFNVHIGTIVKGRSGTLFRVSSVKTRGYTPKERPWIMGNPQKKDGSFGSAVRRLFDRWEVVTP